MLLALVGKGKGSEDGEEEAPPSSARGSEGGDDDRAEELAGEVVDAIMAEDREGAVEALLSLIYCCQELPRWPSL